MSARQYKTEPAIVEKLFEETVQQFGRSAGYLSVS